jgi:polysaccharide biosynthesis/export protein
MFLTGTRRHLGKSLLAFTLAVSTGFTPVFVLAEDAPAPAETASSTAIVGSAPAPADEVTALRANLLEAQKQAYDRELELKKLKEQMKGQAAPEDQQVPKNPWVPVSVSGKQPDSSALQPAVSKPESFQTSIQFYKHHYLLKSGDKLSINFIGGESIRNVDKESAGQDVNATFLQQITILTDGTIVLPPFGVVEVSGKTLKELNDELNNNLANFYRFATITVSLAEPARDDITILGQVKRQGKIQVPVGTTLSQIFKEVGGVQDKADLNHIFIRKKENGNVYMANMAAFLEQGDIGQDIILESGDVIVVPEGQADISYEKYATSTFLPQEFQVKVMGAVSKPDFITMKPGDTLESALSKVGGPLPHALGSKITLVRTDSETNSLKTVELKYKDLQQSTGVNVVLRPNDLIVVEDSKWKRAVYGFATTTGLNALGFVLGQSVIYHTVLKQRNNR